MAAPMELNDLDCCDADLDNMIAIEVEEMDDYSH